VKRDVKAVDPNGGKQLKTERERERERDVVKSLPFWWP